MFRMMDDGANEAGCFVLDGVMLLVSILSQTYVLQKVERLWVS